MIDSNLEEQHFSTNLHNGDNPGVAQFGELVVHRDKTFQHILIPEILRLGLLPDRFSLIKWFFTEFC